MQCTDSTRKLEQPYDGPYEITEVFNDGTVAIQKGIVNECVNIRCIMPYCQMPNYGSQCTVHKGPRGLGRL